MGAEYEKLYYLSGEMKPIVSNLLRWILSDLRNSSKNIIIRTTNIEVDRL